MIGATGNSSDLLSLAPSQEALWKSVKCFAPDDPEFPRMNVVGTLCIAQESELRSVGTAAADLAHRHGAFA